MPVIKNNADACFGIQGTDLDDGPFMTVHGYWEPADTGSKLFFVVPRRMVLKSITARIEVAGTDAGAVTGVIYRAPSGTALSGGTALHSGNINLKGTAATNQALTLSTTSGALDIAAGTAIGIVMTGVLTSAVGGVTLAFCPA